MKSGTTLSIKVGVLFSLPAVRAEWQTGRVRHLWESQLNWSREQRTNILNLADASKVLYNLTKIIYICLSIFFEACHFPQLFIIITKPNLAYTKSCEYHTYGFNYESFWIILGTFEFVVHTLKYFLFIKKNIFKIRQA